jgi:hypothetical protein
MMKKLKSKAATFAEHAVRRRCDWGCIYCRSTTFVGYTIYFRELQDLPYTQILIPSNPKHGDTRVDSMSVNEGKWMNKFAWPILIITAIISILASKPNISSFPLLQSTQTFCYDSEVFVGYETQQSMTDTGGNKQSWQLPPIFSASSNLW